MTTQNNQLQNQEEEVVKITVDDVGETDQPSDLANTDSNTPAPSTGNEPAPTDDQGQEPAPADNRQLDQNGNPVNEDEAEPADNDQGGQDESGIIDTIRDKIGIELETNEFPETEEGVAQFATRAAEQIAQQEFQRIVNSDQLVRDVIEYQNNGGDPRELLYAKYPQTDYTQVEIENDNPEQHKQIVKDYYKELGETEEDISELISDLEQAGKLSDRAQKSLTKLAHNQKERAKKLKEQREQEEQKRQQEAKEFWDNIWNDISKKKDINGIQMPESEKRAFFEYISSPVTQDGMAKADVDRQQRDIDTQMMHDYIDYLANVKGLTLKQLISRSTTNSAARTLRQKLNQEKENDKGGGQNPGDENRGQTGNEEPDMEALYQQTAQQQ